MTTTLPERPTLADITTHLDDLALEQGPLVYGLLQVLRRAGALGDPDLLEAVRKGQKIEAERALSGPTFQARAALSEAIYHASELAAEPGPREPLTTEVVPEHIRQHTQTPGLPALTFAPLADSIALTTGDDDRPLPSAPPAPPPSVIEDLARAARRASMQADAPPTPVPVQAIPAPDRWAKARAAKAAKREVTV